MANACPECGKRTPSGDSNAAACPVCLLSIGLKAGADRSNDSDLIELISDELSPRAVAFHRFGDYEFLEEIARGGMGVVYRAHQLSLNRKVAVKLLLKDRLRSSSIRERFRIEAEATAKLDHPHIVPTLAFGEHLGHPYLAMKLIEGMTLSEAWDCGIINPPSILAKVARAVHYAHGRGILHRDLKPSNILIEESTQEPYVSDFGLAKIQETEAILTHSDTMVGTPHYMAPEQCRCGAGGVTTTSDVYALGVILFEMLEGRPPFTGKTPFEVMQRICEETPSFSATTTVPVDLQVISLKCLEKEPGRRYSSPLALAQDLERFERRVPIQARSVSQPQRLWMWAKRNPLVSTLTAAVFLSLLAGVLTTTTYWRRAERTAVSLSKQSYAAWMLLAWQNLKEERFNESARILKRLTPAPGKEDLRDWEWHFVRQFVEPSAEDSIDLSFDQLAEPTNVGLSTDNRWAVVKRGEGGILPSWIEVWDRQSKRLLRREPSTARSGFAFCQNSGLAAYPSRKGTLCVVSLPELATLWEIEIGTPASTSFSGDGSWLAISDLDTAGEWRLRLFRIHDLSLARTFRGHDDSHILASTNTWESDIALSHDGRLLATSHATHGVRVLDWQQRELVYSDHDERLFSDSISFIKLSFSPNSHKLAVGAGFTPQPLYLVDLVTGTHQTLVSRSVFGEAKTSTALLHGFSFAPNGISLLVDGKDFFDRETGKWLGALRQDPYPAAFSADSRHVATANPEGKLRFHARNHRNAPAISDTFATAIYAFGGSFSTDSRFFVTVLRDEARQKTGIAALIDTKSLQIMRRFDSLGPVTRAIFLPDGRLAIGDMKGTLYVVSDRGVIESRIPQAHPEPLAPARVLRKLNALITLDASRRYKLWDLDSLKPIHSSPPGTLAWPLRTTSNEDVIAKGRSDGRLKWQPFDSPENDYATLLGGYKPSNSRFNLPVDIVRADSGDLLGLSALRNEVWNLTENRLLHSAANGSAIRMHPLDAIFLPGGRRILAKGPTLWDVATGQPVLKELPIDGEVKQLLVSPDGKTIAVETDLGSLQMNVRLFRIP